MNIGKSSLVITKSFCILIVLIIFVFCKPAYAIKIGLLENVNKGYIAVSSRGYIVDAHSKKKLLELHPMQKGFLKKCGRSIVFTRNGKSLNLETNCIIIKSGAKGFVSTKGKWYRGDIVIFNNGKGLTFINNVSLEGYLMGVVPAEMPTSWNYEAHRAQAIAARSYAIANIGKRIKKGYDLKDTPEDQAYGGASAERPNTTNAVLTTKGQVLTYNNKVIPAYYHASSGGHTIPAGRVWGKDLPFVNSVPAYDKHRKKSGHGVGMSQYGANNLAKYGYNAYQILAYYFRNIRFSTVNTNL